MTKRTLQKVAGWVLKYSYIPAELGKLGTESYKVSYKL